MIRTSRHYVIAFNDLSNSKQSEIKEDLFRHLTESNRDYLLEVCGSDPFDIDKPDTDRIANHVEGVIEKACDKAWNELEFNCTL